MWQDADRGSNAMGCLKRERAMTVLQDVNSETAMLFELSRLKAENEALKAKAQRQATARIRLKVSEKGGLSVYGLGRFPVTLYKGQWERLLAMTGDIQEFMLDNSASLTEKE